MEGNDNNSGSSLQYPPGFTPIVATDKSFVHEEGSHTDNVDVLRNDNRKEELDAPSGKRSNMKYKVVGDILCAWDPNSFCKSNATISDYFVIIRGVWRLTGKKLLLIAVYAPYDIRDKQMLWDYLHREIGKWNGEVVIMGDFNEVRYKSDRFGSVFNVHNANVFNSFISNSGLVEVTLGGSIFTWCHKSATKMSKLDRFLVSESLLSTYPNINAITLERYLSDHRPILLRETQYDYGPTPFRFFHHWLDMEGFGNLVEVAWKDSPSNGPNAMRILLAGVKDFRPISLIGSLYKIIAKILTNRLVGVLGDIVNEVQYAFIADRQILDGPFILNEVLKWCKVKKKQALIFKVDFEKAYDSVRWDFLDEVLSKFGFGDKWQKWIQSCLRSSRGSIIVNGSPTEEFQFGRGLKQGDPLSPFLFILIMESLHLSFQRVVDVGMFQDIKLGASVNLSHMFYADDAVFVGQWNDSNITTLVHVLECFYRVSGLKINMGAEQAQMEELETLMQSVILTPISDRMTWTLDSSGEFSVASVMADSLPTRFNISRRGIDIDSLVCVNCDRGVETSRHLFFECCMAKQVTQLINRWWDVSDMEIDSYERWKTWLVNIRMPSRNKKMLEGVYYVMWWLIWSFRNKKIFEAKAPQITAGQSGCDTQPDVPTLTCAPGAHSTGSLCLFEKPDGTNVNGNLYGNLGD
ncbi:RNA-directed DNA polymerase, eukaryota, reverse transcriptase zinc-binding domain protein [Tanacetum coccineum]